VKLKYVLSAHLHETHSFLIRIQQQGTSALLVKKAANKLHGAESFLRSQESLS